MPDDEPVDLINVAFSPQGSSTFETPDRLSGIEAYKELEKACPREWRLVTVNVSFEVCRLSLSDDVRAERTGMPETSTSSPGFDVPFLHW